MKKIWLDKAREFTSRTFNDYCMSIGIDVEQPIVSSHTKWPSRSIHKAVAISRDATAHEIKTPIFYIRTCYITYCDFTKSRRQVWSIPITVVGKEPSFTHHLRIFRCAVYVLIAPSQRTKRGQHRRLEIYVGFESLSIIRYIKPSISDLYFHRLVHPLSLWDNFPNPMRRH